MRTVIVASKRSVKIETAERAFMAVFGGHFKFQPEDIASGVPNQPFDGDTLTGAENRLAYARAAFPDADFWISIEGGLYDKQEFPEDVKLWNRAWIVATDRSGFIGRGQGIPSLLPKMVSRNVREGMELGAAYDLFFKTNGTQNSVGGVHFHH